MHHVSKKVRVVLLSLIFGSVGVLFAPWSAYATLSTPYSSYSTPQPQTTGNGTIYTYADYQAALNGDTSGIEQSVNAILSKPPITDADINQIISKAIQNSLNSDKNISVTDKNITFQLPNGQSYTVDLSEETRKNAEAITKIVAVPETPQAHQSVRLSVTNYGTTLGEDRISWIVNGRVVKNEIGGDAVTFQTGAIGETTMVVVIIDSLELGTKLFAQYSVTPGDVAILWEANTHVPPFYKGKPLPSYRSTVKLIPLPTMTQAGKRVSPENLVYTWKRNHSNQKDLSGYGKRFAFIETGIGSQKELLKLTVTDPITHAKAERTVTFDIVPTKLLFYKGSPLLGTQYEHALPQNITMTNQEMTVVGEPYFFSNEEIDDGSASLVWKNNGATVPSTNRSILLKKGVAQASHIDVSIDNENRILQSVLGTFNVGN